MFNRMVYMLALAFFVFSSLSVYGQPNRVWPEDDEKGTRQKPAAVQESRADAKEDTRSPEARLQKAVRHFDDKALAVLIEELSGNTSEETESKIQLLRAKCYLARCDLRRFMRKTYDLEKKQDKEYRQEEADLAEAGLAHALRALEFDPQSSEAQRVAGELHIHQITGPIAGFRHGPKGRTHVEKAIELDPKNPEAHRAIGLMYLYNPAINGGDPKKAAETFDSAVKMGGDDRAYVLAGRAYLKLEDLTTAKERFMAALKANPDNVEARELLKQMEGSPR